MRDRSLLSSFALVKGKWNGMSTSSDSIDGVRRGAGAPRGERAKGRPMSLIQREERLAWAMVAPALLALLALGFYPALSTLWYALQQGGSFGEHMTWAGLANFARLVRDRQFWEALRFSLLFSLVTVGGQMVFGTGLAVLANQRMPLRWLVRAAVIFPWAIPTATNSVIWAYMFNDQYGLINSLLIRLGLLNPAHLINWLGSTPLATALIYMLAIWKANSLVALLVLAALQGIPEELYEASRVDGASPWYAFWHITLPLLRPALVVTLVIRTIESLQAFDIISAFTNGSPGTTTQNIGLYINIQIQQYGDFGYGSTVATILMLLTLVLIGVYLRTLYRSPSV